MSATIPTTPSPDKPDFMLNPEALTVAIIDQSDDVREFARDAADARLTSELNSEAGRFRRMVRNVWKGNVAREYYRQKYISEAEDSIITEDTLYANREDVGDDARARARSATIMKFVGDYEEAIHESAGEKRKDVSAAEAAGEDGADLVTSATKGLLRDYAEGRLDDASLVEERTRLLAGLRRTSGDDHLFGEGVMVADNILEIAQNVRAAIEHGESIDRVMEQIKVVSGESRSGARTEAQYNRVDKIIAKINGSKVGSLLNEATIITAVSVAASLARVGSTKAINAAGKTLVPGAGAALIAGVRESKHVKDERRQHAREMATGQEYDRGNAKRRDEMQDTLYETVSAESLIEDLATQVDAEQLDGADEARMRDALVSVLNAQARIAMSDSRGMDLIGYSSVTEVETERLVLDVSLARAKVVLRQALDAAGEDMQRALGFDTSEEFGSNLTRISEAQQAVIEVDISEKDKAFNALKRREVAKSAAKAALFGMGIGLVTQEVIAMTSSSRSGLVEQMWHAKNNPVDGRHHDTLLHGFFSDREASTTTITENHTFSGDTTEHLLGNGAQTPVAISEELKLHELGNGKYELLDPSGKSTGTFEMAADGTLTPESIQKMRDLGLTVNDNSTVLTETIQSTRTGTLNDFLEQHKAGTTKISRDLWYDNNTPSPVFDQNELGLQWGGDSGMGVDAQGNYLFNVQAMTADGSFHGDQSALWNQLANEGKLKMAFSASAETQTQVFEITVDANGNAVIPAGSPVAEMFSVQNGHAVFEGKYAEVVQTMGTDQAGTEHVRMLATHIGEDTLGDKPFDIPDVEVITTNKPAFEILDAGYSTSHDVHELAGFVEMAPVIPVYGRKSLEDLLSNPDITPYYMYSPEASDIGETEKEKIRTEISPRLLDNPEAELDQTEEIKWYLDKQDKKHLKKIEKHADSIGESITESTEISVAIPVAGHQEGDNIYRTLEAYSDQTLDNSKYEIVLFVNHPTHDRDGNVLNADKTLAEIERFKADHPDMNIKVMYEALPRSQARIGLIRKTLTDTILLRKLQSGDKGELAVVSNDADTLDVNPKYLETLLTKLKENKRSDVVAGQLEWDTSSYVNHPAIHVGTRMFQMFNILLRTREGYPGVTSGANTTLRASILAAVGGYSDLAGGEDTNLGTKIEVAREGSSSPTVVFGGVVASRITTSARRAVLTLLKHNEAPLHQWNFGFSADDDDVRSIGLGGELDPPDYKDPKVRIELVQQIEHIINRTLSNGPEGAPVSGSAGSVAPVNQWAEKYAQYYERILGFMGVEFEWQGSYKTIKITNADRLLRGLEDFAAKKVTEKRLSSAAVGLGVLATSG
ncbi:hypothetical protein KBD20_01955 [Candidatus Saccharibacteria bacterium]|nr:hypothetical protein [Candidatus Saccharibacteria bacterium]